jgi:hypothetical protein
MGMEVASPAVENPATRMDGKTKSSGRVGKSEVPPPEVDVSYTLQVV